MSGDIVKVPVPGPPPKAHQRIVTSLTGTLNSLAREADQLAEQHNLLSLGDGLARIREFRKAVTDLEHHIETHVAALMESDQVNLGDDVTLERRRGKKRTKWQSEDIFRELVSLSFADGNGEARDVEDAFRVLIAAVNECVPLTGSLAWRTGALRVYGIDPDEFCTSEPGRLSVSVKTRGDDPDAL